MKAIVTYTDTFGGEANGAWVKRYEFNCNNNISTRAVVIRAKKLTGLTNYRSRSYDYGDSVTIRPTGRNEIITVDFE